MGFAEFFFFIYFGCFWNKRKSVEGERDKGLSLGVGGEK